MVETMSGTSTTTDIYTTARTPTVIERGINPLTSTTTRSLFVLPRFVDGKGVQVQRVEQDRYPPV